MVSVRSNTTQAVDALDAEITAEQEFDRACRHAPPYVCCLHNEAVADVVQRGEALSTILGDLGEFNEGRPLGSKESDASTLRQARASEERMVETLDTLLSIV